MEKKYWKSQRNLSVRKCGSHDCAASIFIKGYKTLPCQKSVALTVYIFGQHVEVNSCA